MKRLRRTLPQPTAEEAGSSAGLTLSLRRARTEPDRVPCPHDAAFRAWTTGAIRPYLRDATPAVLNQLYILLQHRYMDFYVSVPRACRESVGTRGHSCIHTVLVETYQAIRKIELELVPLPMISHPPVSQNTPSATAIALPPIPDDEQPNSEEEDDQY